MESPFSDVTALSAPCRFGPSTVTVTPGTARLWLSITRPVIVPDVVCADAVPAATIIAAKTDVRMAYAIQLLINCMLKSSLWTGCKEHAMCQSRGRDGHCSRDTTSGLIKRLAASEKSSDDILNRAIQSEPRV